MKKMLRKLILVGLPFLLIFFSNSSCNNPDIDGVTEDSLVGIKIYNESLLSMSILDLPSNLEIEEQIDSNKMKELWKSIPEKWDCSNAFVFTLPEGNKRIPKIGKLIYTEVARDEYGHWLKIVHLAGAKSEKYTLFEVVPEAAFRGANSLMDVSKMGGKVGLTKDEARLFILYFRSVGNKNKIKEWEEFVAY